MTSNVQVKLFCHVFFPKLNLLASFPVVKCNPPVPEDNSYFTEVKTTSYQFGEKVILKCQKGAFSLYLEPGTESTPLGQIEKSCTEYGVWSDNTLQCLREFLCLCCFKIPKFYFQLFSAHRLSSMKLPNTESGIHRLRSALYSTTM